MARQVFEYADPDRFIVGTVGMPGERTFFIQARKGTALTSVVAEKAQISALADRIDQLLDEVRTSRTPSEPVPARDEVEVVDAGPLDVPIAEEFRVGAMALGWDDARERVVIEAHAIDEESAEVPEIADDDADGADTLRVWVGAREARAFAARARSVVAAGRPPCPFCSQPLDPEGHLCPRANGFRRR